MGKRKKKQRRKANKKQNSVSNVPTDFTESRFFFRSGSRLPPPHIPILYEPHWSFAPPPLSEPTQSSFTNLHEYMAHLEKEATELAEEWCRSQRTQRQVIVAAFAKLGIRIKLNESSGSSGVHVFFSEEKQEPAEDSTLSAIRKYWFSRHSLFTHFDHGVLIDYVGWFSVTPEAVSRHVALRCSANTIIDAFAGVGRHVIAIDLDPTRLLLCRRNAEIYGVADRIEFICGDFLQLAPGLRADVVFLAPPWGGPDYIQQERLDLQKMGDLNGVTVFEKAAAITPNIVYFLPRNIDTAQVAALTAPGCHCELEAVHFSNSLKFFHAYFGQLVQS